MQYSIAFAKGGVVTGGSSGHLYIWEGVVLQRTLLAHNGPIYVLHAYDQVSNLVLFLKMFCNGIMEYIPIRCSAFTFCKACVVGLIGQLTVIAQMCLTHFSGGLSNL